jgi:hypothetical protein
MSGGTDLYRRMLAFNYDDQERSDLMRKVWSPTPWMVNVFDGGWSRGRDRCFNIGEWCAEHFGPQGWPIHGKPGRWYRGNATVHGWTWYGFASESDMNAFMAAWPNPPLDPSEQQPLDEAPREG